jgi:hypothetical protein
VVARYLCVTPPPAGAVDVPDRRPDAATTAGEWTSVPASVYVGGAPQFILAVAERVVLVHAVGKQMSAASHTLNDSLNDSPSSP